MNDIMLTLLTCKDSSQNLHDNLSNVSIGVRAGGRGGLQPP